ncbi:MAG: hypothetical protein COA78_12980 [Blastopirellula sp.]|nr:MAG: hypothetical protein COA78_12980 [Blastopirellula sp.]
MAEQFTGLPMDDLISSPLMAAAKANSMMATTQTRFMLDTCFEADETGEGENKKITYKPIMIKMELTRGVLIPKDPTKEDEKFEIQETKTKFDLPILTIIPLNSLAVDEVKITFDMEVKSSYGESTSKKREEALAGQASWEAKVGYGPFSASVKGSVSYDSKSMESRDTHYEKSNSAQYSVLVHASQIQLPKGVTTIIDAFAKAIDPITMPVNTGTPS